MMMMMTTMTLCEALLDSLAAGAVAMFSGDAHGALPAPQSKHVCPGLNSLLV